MNQKYFERFFPCPRRTTSCRLLPIPIIFLLIFLTGGCQKSPSNPETLSSRDPQTLRIKLKEGIKIDVKYIELDSDSLNLGKPTLREVTLENPSGAEGLTLAWQEKTENSQVPLALPQGQVITLGEDGKLPAGLQGLVNPDGGQLSLPNLTQARRMTPPAFWPQGDLYLSDSSGIWLSDVAFEELKRNGRTEWDPGLLNNPMLGPAEGLAVFRLALARLQNRLKDEEDKTKEWTALKLKGEKKFPLPVDGKLQTVDVLEVENEWLALTVLDNAKNPLILQFQIAPSADLAELLFSPLGVLKGLVEYQVTGFRNPKPEMGGVL